MDLGRVLLDERHEQEQLQLFQRAMKSMRELVEAYPDRPFYRYELIDMLRNAAIFRNRRGLSDEATRFYRAAVQETESWMVEVDEPQREKIACQAALGINLNSLGVRIVETGDYAEAAELFRRACEHDLACAQWRAESRMPAQSLVQVQCLVRPQADVTSEDHRQALRCIERSLEHHNSAEGRYLHGVALLRVGRTNEALRRLEAVDHLKARFFLALAYYQLGKTNEARAAFEEANTWLDENPAEVKYYGNVRDEVAELLDATISEVATPNDSDQKIDP
jgi:tetratricopeptide (TPR) repeat protein